MSASRLADAKPTDAVHKRFGSGQFEVESNDGGRFGSGRMEVEETTTELDELYDVKSARSFHESDGSEGKSEESRRRQGKGESFEAKRERGGVETKMEVKEEGKVEEGGKPVKVEGVTGGGRDAGCDSAGGR